MANPQGIVQTDSMNRTQGKHVHNRSRFNDSLSYRKSFTARFGEYVPSFEMNGVPSDSISLNSHDLIDSLSLKAPFKGNIRKIKESFSVPNMAILPMNWDLIYTQPSNGDDVPADANCVLQNFPVMMSTYWMKYYDLVNTYIGTWNNPSLASEGTTLINAILKCIILGEYIYSHGALLNVVGYKASAQWHFKKAVVFYPTTETTNPFESVSYDLWFDNVVRLLFSNVLEFKLNIPVGSQGLETYKIRSITASGESPSGNPDFYNSFRFFLEKMRENPACYISDVVLAAGTPEATYMNLLTALIGNTSSGLFEPDMVQFYLPQPDLDAEDFTDMSPCNLNLSRLLAYQLVCAHFYTNSSIDVVYSAELYRSYVHYLFRQTGTNPANIYERQFSWNGYEKLYDFLSEYYLTRQLYLAKNATGYFDPNDVLSPTIANLTDKTDSGYLGYMARLASFAAIFGFRHSLRFGDYFVGSRPRPLAPFNTDVAVAQDNTVSVVDITRKQWAQKFANAVMRSRQKIEEYVGDLFGNRPAPDFHNPFFLSRETESIFGDEVQNTGASQVTNANSRTALFASQPGRFTFTFKNDDMHPCIYLQIISFDVRRSYTRSVDRQFFELTRYDMFNPDFQYIGDQPVYGAELGYLFSGVMPAHFGYQSRDMEYKQRFDVASGGFVENLRGWLMTDRQGGLFQRNQLTPDFIRSFSCEFDQFYLALTGYSLGSYFHLAIITDNNVDATRPMAVDPQILE